MTTSTPLSAMRRWLIPTTFVLSLALAPTLGCGARQEPNASSEAATPSPIFRSRDAMLAVAERAPSTASDAFMAAQIRMVQGDEDAALTLLLTPGLRWDEPALSIARSLAIYRLRSTAIRFDESVVRWLAEVGLQAEHPYETWVRHELAHFIAVRQSVREDAPAPAESVAFGQADTWRVVGPVGVDVALAPDDLGLAGTVASLRDLPPRLGRVEYVSYPNASRLHTDAVSHGMLYAESIAEVDTAGEFLLVTRAPSYYSVWINGERVEFFGPEQSHDARQRVRRIALEAGTHRIVIAMNHQSGADGLSFRLVPLTGSLSAFGADVPLRTTPAPHVLDEGNVAPSRWLTTDGKRPLDWLIAAEFVEASSDQAWAERLLSDGFPRGDALAQFTRYRLTSFLRGLQGSLRDSLALQELRDIDATWLPLASVSMELAASQQRVGQLADARAALVEAARADGASPHTRRQYAMLLHESGMASLAEQQLKAINEDVPLWCSGMASLLYVQLQRGRAIGESDLQTGWQQCSEIRRFLSVDVAQRRGDMATVLRFYERLLGRSPNRLEDWSGYLRALRLSGDAARFDAALARAATVGVSAEQVAMQRVLRALGRDDVSEAMEELASAQRRNASDFLTRLPFDFLNNQRFLHEFRIDGDATIAAYRADKNAVSGEIVYVLDYGRWRFFEEGGGVAVVHQIFELNSRDALESMGEIDAPSGAALLSVRVIKPDGRSVIPDPIAGKSSISFPKLELGDMIELEWARAITPISHNDDWYTTGGFYFSSNEGPMFHSELVVEYPAAWGEHAVMEALRLGDAEHERTVREDLIRERYVMRNAPEVRIEPVAPDPDEYLPMASFSAFLQPEKNAAYYASRILPTLALSDAIRARAASLTQGLHDDEARIHALFRYVNDAIEQTGGFFAVSAEQTEVMEHGDRSALLFALLKASNYEPEIVFIRPFDAPDVERTPEQLGDWTSVAVRVATGDAVYWLDPNEDFAPFNLLAPYAMGRPAFVVVGTTIGARYQTPELAEELLRHTVELHITLAEDGSSRVDSREVLPLDASAQMRRFLDYVPNPRDVERMFEQRESREYGGAQLQSLSYAGADDPDMPMIVSSVLEVPQMATRRGEMLSIDRGFSVPLSVAMAADRVERKLPLLFDESEDRDMRVTLVAPAGYSIQRVPTPVTLEWGTMRYERAVTVDPSKKKATWTRRFTLPRQRIQPSDYAGFAAFMRQVMESERIRVDIGR